VARTLRVLERLAYALADVALVTNESALRVAVERGAVADEHAGRAELEKRFARSGDDRGMRVDETARVVADKIGFEKDGLVFDGEGEFAEAFVDDGQEVFCVTGDLSDEDAGGRTGERGDKLAVAKIHGCGW